jgi:iron complex outermembrane receptor protein
MGENLIQGSMNSEGTIIYQNAGEIDNTGIELLGNFKANDWLLVNSNYTYISMKNPVLATPTQKLYVGTSAQFNKLTAQLSFQLIQGLYSAVGMVESKENYNLLNAHVFYQLIPSTSVFLKAENLLNQDYSINMGYPMPGFTLFGGLKFSFTK